MFQAKFVGQIKTSFMYSNFSPKIMSFMRSCGKIW